MKTIADILGLSQVYLDKHNEKVVRYNNWKDNAYPIVQTTLHKICRELVTKNDYFKSNLYVVDGNAAVGIYLKSGNMPVISPEQLSEIGFQIHFAPVYNGKIHVYAFDHSIDNETPRHNTIEVIDDPLLLTEEKVIELVFAGFEMVSKSSHLFIGD